MVVDAAAILAILTRQPDADALIAGIEAAAPPVLVSPLSVVEATLELARRKSATPADWAAVLGQARLAIGEFLSTVGAREVSLTAELGRRALDLAAAGEADAERCFAQACAAGYRTRLVSARPLSFATPPDPDR